MMALAKISGKYVGKKFSEVSCLDLVHGWFRDLGVYLPKSFQGLTLKTYMSFWHEDRDAAIGLMLDYFNIIGCPVDNMDIRCHDLLAVEENGNIYAAICLENNMAIASNFSQGVRVFHLGVCHRVVLARRVI